MTLLMNFGWLGLGLAMLYFGAEWLVKGSSALALRAGISPLAVGLTVVAFGTSAPELAVSIDATKIGQGGLALGNVVGSNICNLALVLGAAALVRPLGIHRQVVRFDLPLLIVVSLVFIGFLFNDGDVSLVSRTEGIILTAGIVAYVAYSLIQSKRQSLADSAADVEVEGLEADEVEAAKKASLPQILWYLALIIVGLLMLVKGADFLIKGGVTIAEIFSVPKTLIGLSLVAIGTSLPELATSIVATLRGHGDIITGNAVGSCIFNVMAVIGIAAIISPISTTELKHADLFTMLGVTVLMLPFMASKRSISRIEGAVLIAGYLGYCVYLFKAY